MRIMLLLLLICGLGWIQDMAEACVRSSRADALGALRHLRGSAGGTESTLLRPICGRGVPRGVLGSAAPFCESTCENTVIPQPMLGQGPCCSHNYAGTRFRAPPPP